MKERKIEGLRGPHNATQQEYIESSNKTVSYKNMRQQFPILILCQVCNTTGQIDDKKCAIRKRKGFYESAAEGW